MTTHWSPNYDTVEMNPPDVLPGMLARQQILHKIRRQRQTPGCRITATGGGGGEGASFQQRVSCDVEKEN